MKISETLSKSCIDLNVKFKNKYDIIHYFMEKLACIHNLDNQTKEVIIDEIISREKLMSTGLQNGVAIPHCSTKHINEPMTFIGISKDGMDFGSADGISTNIIVMLVVPKSQLNDHVKKLAIIARLLNQETIRNKMLLAEKPEEIIELFKKTEE